MVEGEWWADRALHAGPKPDDRAPVADTIEREAVAAPPELPELPESGRHAARRRLLPVLPEMPAVGVGHLAVIAVVVAVALAGTTWWLLRDRAEAVPAPASTGSEVAALVPASDAPAAEPTESDTVTVDVAGKVRRPGIVVLDKGARVIDALEAAGGPRKGVETTTINLARVLVDGEQIVVGSDVPAAPVTDSAVTSSGGLINLNLANQGELESLPQIGPVTAAAIIAWREQHGGFSSVDQLIEVDGIGEKTLAQIAPHATV